MRKGVRITTPCSAAWEEMFGDDQVRFCPKCHLHVYNFAQMRKDEVNELLHEREGRLCAKIYQRACGTILTKDSPVAFRVLPLLPGITSNLQSEAVDLLIEKHRAVLPETPPLPSKDPGETGISLLAYDSVGSAASSVAFYIQDQKTGVRIGACTDQAGRLRFSGIPTGKYLLDCGTPGLAMRTQVIEIAEGEVVSVEVELFSSKMGVIFEIDAAIVPHPE